MTKGWSLSQDVVIAGDVSAPRKAVNVDTRIYHDGHRKDFAGIHNADHAFYFSSPQFIQDIYLTLQDEIERSSIPTRFAHGGKPCLRP